MMENNYMNKQTLDYIALKPLSDKFKEVCENISNDDIKNIIKDEIREKVKEELDGVEIPLCDIVEEWFSSYKNTEWVINTLKQSISNKLTNKETRW